MQFTTDRRCCRVERGVERAPHGSETSVERIAAVTEPLPHEEFQFIALDVEIACGDSSSIRQIRIAFSGYREQFARGLHMSIRRKLLHR